jgi:hypothetical protein
VSSEGGAAKIRFELLSLFRHKAGTGRIDVEVGADSPAPATDSSAAEGGPTALDALRCLEARFAPGALGALDGERLRRGVLLFVRGPGIPMRRIADPARELVREGLTLILATAMEGG